MLEYTEKTRDPRVLPRPERDSGAHDNLDVAPTTSRVSRVKGRLSGWRLASVEALCRSPMEQLGYELVADGPVKIP